MEAKEKPEWGDTLDDEKNQDTMKNRFLTFRVGQEDYAIEIRYVIEIIGIQKITEVPDMPPYVKGMINLRGKVIPVIDVRLRFKLEERDYDDRTCTVVVRVGESTVGLIVDTVSEVLDIPEDHVSPPPQIQKSSEGRFIQGMGRVDENVKILLDVHKLLYTDIEELSLEAAALES